MDLLLLQDVLCVCVSRYLEKTKDWVNSPQIEKMKYTIETA